ncbi:23511_t:CDS:2, partial [Cetraspora pellucida]
MEVTEYILTYDDLGTFRGEDKQLYRSCDLRDCKCQYQNTSNLSPDCRILYPCLCACGAFVTPS